MRTLLFLAIAFTVFGSTGLAQKSLGGKRWQLVELNGEKPKDPRAYIEFNETEKRITGNGGCNRMFGTYESGDGGFKTSGIGSTRMMCMKPGTMENESALFKALGEAVKLNIKGGDLSLYDSSGVVIAKFRSDQKRPVGPATLTSRKWMLQSIEGKKVLLEENPPFLNLTSGASGSSGCNSFGGGFELNGSSIKFKDILQTLIGCGGERGEVERGFLGGLGNTDRYVVKKNTLTFYQGDKELLTFTGTTK